MGLLTGLDVALRLERNGVVWTLPPSQDLIPDELFFLGEYAGPEIRAVMAFLAKERAGYEWIVDVGANVGTTTVPFARAGHQVLSIEPVPDTARFLHLNVESNGLGDRVRVMECAVSEQPEVLIAVCTSPGNSEAVLSADAVPAFAGYFASVETITVPGSGLDDALDRAGVAPDSVAVVWSDTQGSEMAVMSTGARLWAGGVPLFAEFYPGGLQKFGGVHAFVDRATDHFVEFIDRESLLSGSWTRRPLAELHDVAVELRASGNSYTDVLLLPAGRAD
jgi:FkbM family methyltransferase